MDRRLRRRDQLPRALTCESGNNNSNFCDKEYDRLVEKARRTQDDEQRFEIYSQLEEKLVGENGAMPILPIYYYTYVEQERESVKETFNRNLLDQIDLTQVKVTEA